VDGRRAAGGEQQGKAGGGEEWIAHRRSMRNWQKNATVPGLQQIKRLIRMKRMTCRETTGRLWPSIETG
jgi:hypothetical protein